MTTEEKARAYDEALTTAKRIISKNCSEVEKLCLKCIFPTLSESEDERIRKWLYDFVHNCPNETFEFYGGVGKKAVLAYLEKQKEPENVSASTMIPSCWEVEQKEQKPDSLIYDKDLDKAAREFYLSGGAASPVDSTGLVPIVRMAEFGATWMKERMEKEQKPCWNPTEEDVALFNKAITTNASLSPQERAKLDILRMKFKHRPVIEQKEQKSAEWSDYKDKVNVPYCSSEPEWSEEDEKMLRTIISDGSRGVELDSKQISFLKSLRPQPHWKPSEQQMEALKNSAYGSYQNGDGPILRELYEQLKKLI